MITRGAALIIVGLLLAACDQGNATNEGSATTPAARPSPTCITYSSQQPPSTAVGYQPRGLVVPFTPITGAFHLGGQHWTLVHVSSGHPVTVGVRLGHDLGMYVDAVQFVVKPYTYQGGDDGLRGSVFSSTTRDLRAEGQPISATFAGLDNTGARLPKGVYKVMVSITGHRTSMSTCEETGPVDAQHKNHSGTGVIIGLASIGGAPRPRTA